ncbi:MAG: hypothetical protein WA979_08360 [Pacificimonas sp.]
MLGKIIGATAGRKAANMVGSKVGGPIGAAIGYGLVSRRFRKAAFGGLAVIGGLALYRRLRGERDAATTPFVDEARGNGMAAAELPATDVAEANGDPLPAYAAR